MTPLPALVSAGFTPALWRDVAGFDDLTDITYHRGVERQGGREADQPWVRVAFNRPEVRNAFTPATVDQLIAALSHAAESPDVVAVLLAGNGPSPKDGGHAFCSGGDQRFRGASGYEYGATREGGRAASSTGEHDAARLAPPADAPSGAAADALDDAVRARAGSGPAGAPAGLGGGRLHVLEAQRLIRTMPKPVIAVVDGWAAGGGHSLHVVADLTLACREHGRFKQTDATVASFDDGYGSALLARQVGQKRAREIFFLARTYTAEQAERWGAVNLAVDHEDVEATAIEWAAAIAGQSPQAIRALKFAFNLPDDGLAGQQLFAAEATRLAYGTAEAAEGRDAFLERRPPRWDGFRRQIL
ncbi:MAG: 1,4-dihydroxy-2-naphthoyl-CoA synthase [Bifidobacteriaceae bacterium]|jgi:naphthoate synthase|nr:1,4-dihydroxy-2-naphthoyl-CoA synthase [Bifidobacteriaceae bacterium]